MICSQSCKSSSKILQISSFLIISHILTCAHMNFNINLFKTSPKYNQAGVYGKYVL